MKKTSMSVLLFLFCGLFVSGQPYLGGSDIFRLGSTGSRTISNASDVITIGLVSVDLTKTSGLFKEDAQAGVLIKATISGYDKPSNTKQSTTIERLYLVDVTKYPTGKVSLPIEGTLLDNFPLSFEKNVYTKVDLEIILLKKRKDTDFGFALKNVAKLTQNLPIPSNPFDPVIKIFSGSINDLLSPENDAENNIRERVPTGIISLNFLPSSPFATKTGIFAVIFGTDTPLEPGYIDIKKPNDYIFTVQTEPKRAILVASQKSPDIKDELRNDNLMFFIEAFATNVDKQQNIKTSIQKSTSINFADPAQIQGTIIGSPWYAKTEAAFTTTFVSALKQYNQSSEFTPFLKPEDLYKDQIDIGSTQLLMLDYIRAIEQRRELGIDKLESSKTLETKKSEIANLILPVPSIYLLKIDKAENFK